MQYPAPKVTSEGGRSLRWVGAIGSLAFKWREPVDLVGWGAGGATLRTLIRLSPLGLREWDLAAGVSGARLEPSQWGFVGVGVGPSRALLALDPFSPRDRVVELWDLDRRAVIGRLPWNAFAPEALAASQDGRLAVALSRNTVTTYALPACERVASIAGRGPVAVSADGAMFVARSVRGSEMRVWAADGRPLGGMRAPGAGAVVAATFGPEGRSVVAALGDGSLACWDLATRDLRWRVRHHEQPVTALGRAPDASVFVSVDEGGLVCATAADGSLRWTARLGRSSTRFRVDVNARPQVDVSPDGATVAVARPGYALRILDAATGVERSFIEGHDGRVSCVAVSANGLLVASGGEDGDVRVYDVAREETAWTLEVDREAVLSVEFLPDRRALRTCGRDGSVRQWSLVSGMEEAHRDVVPASNLRHTRGALDGSRVLVFCRGRIELWSDQRAEPVVWSYPSGFVRDDGCFARHGRVLVRCGNGAEVRDGATGQPVEVNRLYPGRLLKLQETHRGPVAVTQERDELTVVEEWGERRARSWKGSQLEGREARVSSDGCTLVVRDDRRMEVWDLRETPTLIGRAALARGEDALTSVALSADGAVIAAGTELGCVLVFAVDPAR